MNTKRMLALLICAVMALSLIPVMAITASAAEAEGDWHVYRDPEKYEDLEPGEVVKPDAGYEYTADGFTTIAPDWTNYTPFLTAQTKEAQPLKEGFYMQIRMDSYPYGGESGDADHWISFNLSDRAGVHLGSVDDENNWLSLIRGDGAGSASAHSFLTTMTTEEKAGHFIFQFASDIEIPMDDEGREIYTFEVTYDGAGYELKINGVVVSNRTISDALNAWVESGEYYVGVSLHAGIPDATLGMTILKHGTSAADATTPVGFDRLEPEILWDFPPITEPDTTKTPETRAPEVTAEAPVTRAPEVTTEAPATRAPVGTTAEQTTEPVAEGGCASVVGFGAVAILAAAAVVLKKKD